MLIKDLCKQMYLKQLQEGDEYEIELWSIICIIVNESYIEGYEDGQHV